MGISAQQMLGNDPEYLQRQLRQQQIQGYMAPFQSQQERSAGLLGGVLGGGIANLFQGKGFFDVTDPALQRVSQVNGIISEGLKGVDPTDKAKMAKAYGDISKRLADAGFAQPAALAAAEANKFVVTPTYADVSAVTGVTKDGKRVPLIFDKTNGSYKYRDKKGNLLDWTGDVDYRPAAENQFTAAMKAAQAAQGGGGQTDAERAAAALAKRKAEEKARYDAAVKDPLADNPEDTGAQRAEKAKKRKARDAERAKAASDATDWTVAP